ncbi:MAG: class I SAM-dependent methyltransferase, partial [Bacteroidota bacterium]|nr:class I SAM-dependent methyltransferase [Bacteroidota bacterium]
FDVAVNIFTSFGYFEKDEDNFKVIRNVSNSLKRGGYFVFDFLNKNYIEKNLIPYSKSKQGDIMLIQKRRIEDGLVKKNIIIKSKHETLNYTESLKLYSLKEFKNVFRSFKFRIQNLFGDYYGNKYNENKSQRLIIIAKKT